MKNYFKLFLERKWIHFRIKGKIRACYMAADGGRLEEMVKRVGRGGYQIGREFGDVGG